MAQLADRVTPTRRPAADAGAAPLRRLNWSGAAPLDHTHPGVPVLSAGLLLFRRGSQDQLQVLLAHPGGPFWARKDDGAWSVPKGEHEPDEEPRAAARREFLEEVGMAPPAGRELALGERRQPSGKRLTVWAIEGDLDPADSHSNEVTMEWPRGSGRTITFPEVDRVEWFDLATARAKLLRGQVPFLDDLVERLAGEGC